MASIAYARWHLQWLGPNMGPVSWRPMIVKWRQSSQSNRHLTIGTRQTEYHEALLSSANVQSHLTSSFANDGNASWYSVCRVPMVEWRLDCENCRYLTVVDLHDTGPSISSYVDRCVDGQVYHVYSLLFLVKRPMRCWTNMASVTCNTGSTWHVPCVTRSTWHLSRVLPAQHDMSHVIPDQHDMCHMLPD